MNVILALPLAAAFSIRFRRRFEETIAPAIFVLIIALYFSGIFTTLLPGVAACFAMSAAALVYCAVRLFKASPETDTALPGSGDEAGSELRRGVIARILTPGAAAFLLFAVCFIMFNLDREFCSRDDLSHWARAVKNYLYYQDLSNIAPSTDRNGTYPPAAALWNYLGALLYPRNGSFFVDRTVTPLPDAAGAQFFSQEMLEAALFLPLFSSVKRFRSFAEGGRFLLLVAAFFMIPSGSFSVWFSSVMVDPLLGLYGLFILWMLLHGTIERIRSVHKENPFFTGAACGALFVLALTKEMGIILAGLLAMIIPLFLPMPVREVQTPGRGGHRGILRSEKVRLIVRLSGSVALAVTSWYGYLALWNRIEMSGLIQKSGDTQVTSGTAGGGTVIRGHVGTLLYKLTDLDPQLSWDIFRTYCYSLFDKRRAPFGAFFPVPFFAAMLLCALLVLVVVIRRVRSGSFRVSDRCFCRIFAGSWVIGWLFCGCLGIAYVVIFRKIGITLPSLDRYLAPVIVMLTGLMIGFWLERMEGTEERQLLVWYAAGMILLLLYGDVRQLYAGWKIREDRSLPVSEMTADIAASDVVFSPEDRVYLHKLGDHVSDERYALGYIVTPAKINNKDYDLDPKDVKDPEYNYLYDAELPVGKRLFRRDEATGLWESVLR